MSHSDYEQAWKSQFKDIEYVIGVPVELIDEIFPIIGKAYHTTQMLHGYVIYTFSLSQHAPLPSTTLCSKGIPHIVFSERFGSYDITVFHFTKQAVWEYSPVNGVSGGLLRAFNEVVRNGLFDPRIQTEQYYRYKTLQLLKVKP